MQSTQPTLQYEIILQMKRNERKAEDRKLQMLKERLLKATKYPTLKRAS
jgi:hypothetical protein